MHVDASIKDIWIGVLWSVQPDHPRAAAATSPPPASHTHTPFPLVFVSAPRLVLLPLMATSRKVQGSGVRGPPAHAAGSAAREPAPRVSFVTSRPG